MGVEKFQLKHDSASGQLDAKQLSPCCDAQNFQAKNIACVVYKEETFTGVLRALECLGFEVACSSELEAVFKVVAEDPEDWAMIIIRLDQPIDEERLESHVRLLRMMDARIPILVMAARGKAPEHSSYPNLYSDCVVREPASLIELSLALKAGKDANMIWGSRFCHFSGAQC